MKCKEFQIGDWIQDENGSPMRIIKVGRDYACAIFGDNECPWAFEDDDVQPEGIPITPEILEKNGWYYGLTSDEEEAEYSLGGCHYGRHWSYDEGAGSISLIFPNEADGGELIIDDQSFNRHLNFVFCDTMHVHELQRALRCCGLWDIADSFVV